MVRWWSPFTFWHSLGLTRRFLILYSLIAILPVIGFFLISMRGFNDKWNRHVESQLKTAVRVAQTLYADDMAKLQAKSRQVSRLSLDELYYEVLTTGKTQHLEHLLNLYQRTNGFDLVMLVDADGQIIAQSEQFHPANEEDFQNAIHRSLVSGKSTVFSDDFYRGEDRRHFLTQIAMTPILHRNKSIGLLVTGQRVRNNASLTILPKLTGIQYSLFLLQPDDAVPVISSFAHPATDLGPEDWDEPQEQSQTLYVPETVDGVPYRALAVPIKNWEGKVRGVLEVSTSEIDLFELEQQDWTWLTLYWAVCMVLLILLALWFQRQLLAPLMQLSDFTRQISQGDRSFALEDTHFPTEIQNLSHALHQMVSTLEENEQLRKTFISSLTHDMRVPLLAEGRAIEFLAECKAQLPPQYQDLIEQLGVSNAELLAMVNQLLESYQLESGQFPMMPTQGLLKPVVEETVQKLSPLAQTKQIQLQCHLPETSQLLYFDHPLIQRVLTNLVGNAIENCLPGSHIDVFLTETAEESKVTVQDNGPGILEADQPHLFQRYFGTTKTQRKLGSGLGLFTCRLIIECHGGKIGCESTLGQGSTFFFTLPREESEAE